MATAPAPASQAARAPRAAGPAPVVVPVLGITLVALLATSLAVVIGGAATAAVAGLQDPGAVVRWGLPLVRVVHDLAASLTIGLLLVGALLLPGTTASKGRGTPPTMLRAGRLAMWSGGVWVVAGLVGVVLGFADAAGTPLDSPVFLSQLQTFVWQLETLRVGVISSALAAVAATIAGVALTRKGLATAAFVAVGAMLPLALAGHAAGGSDHETAVNTIAFHLVGASLWVGGLLALAVLRPLLGKRLAPVVARYSALALWCYVTVLVSGVASAWLRLGSVAGLATSYGALIVVKAVALVVLGVLGWHQRRRVVDRLAVDPTSRALFASMALVELAVMGVAFGFATALARSAPPVPDTLPPLDPAQGLTGYPAPPAPVGLSWLSLWRFDWLWGVLAVVAVAVYVVWVVRLHRRGDRWSVLRTGSWVLGWAVVVWTVCGPPGVLGRVSFSWHMIEHMVLAMLAPVFLVLAAPVTLGLRGMSPRRDGSLGPRELLLGMVHSRLLRVLGNPVVAAVLFFASLAVFYYSPLFGLALETHTGHVLMVAHFLLTGYLFVWVLVGVDPGPPKWSAPMRLVILLVTISFHAFFGVSLMTGTTLLAPDFFQTVQIPWVPDVLADQQLGGSYAWGIGEVPTLLLAMLVVAAWVRSDAAETRRGDRQA
ncbi:MAG: bifunctional copper resistance protein CopD/cytochrome c oxidase assembly protein, partial [Actinomycetota bacterium]|nr:bifunctional copper resistance protein CopD/cytochrome c oxidase assembly protein [Actinomycetota bacterium]